jgi:hypothetical protein
MRLRADNTFCPAFFLFKLSESHLSRVIHFGSNLEGEVLKEITRLSEGVSDLIKDSLYLPFSVEMQFYKFAHSADNDSRKASLSQIKELLEEGTRSPGWDLSDNVRSAIKDGHPCPEFLSQLAKVISEEEDITSLDRFDTWTKEEEC